ncbi:MAG TPA: type II toxin-antitoxin system RelE/ParE family toxin [Longimicrobium sp.]|nr:type II toxin-antitoxin system RelE/ParE family toxin [Longimicrobium sp.]
MRVVFTAAAIEERRAAVKFYRDQSGEVARAFERELRAVIALLKQRPLLGTPHHEGMRRKLFPRFPYAVIYEAEVKVLTVHAVMHQRREPGYWVDRLNDDAP